MIDKEMVLVIRVLFILLIALMTTFLFADYIDRLL